MEPVTRPVSPPVSDDRTGLPWRPFVAVLTGLALFTSLQLILAYRWKPESLPLLEAVLSGLATWYPWLVLAPLVFWVCRRFRFDGGPWWRTALVHLPASFVFGGLWTLIRWGLSHVPWIDERPLGLERVAIAHLYL